VTDREKARTPEDLARLFAERANAKDAAGIAALYEQNAVLGYPPGEVTTGRVAIEAIFEATLPQMPPVEPEEPGPTLSSGNIALTSTPASRGEGARAQVVRRQPDGTWLRLLDLPEVGR
jgi:ketosteroid isomerase-like protein